MLYSELAERIALESGGIPEFILDQILPLCANDFFTDSRIWRKRSKLHVKGRRCLFSHMLDDEEYVVRVERMETPDGVEIPAITNNPSTEYSLSYTFSTHGIELHGDDDKLPTHVLIEVSVAPSILAEEIPDELLFHCRRAITALVLSRAYMTPNREWTNNGLSVMYLKQYDEFLADAKRLGSGNKANVNRECTFSW